MIKEAKRIGEEQKRGKYSTEARLVMYEKTIVPTITYNLECWTKMREKDRKDLERIQGKALRSLLHLPESTPYWGLLKETGIWPIERIIHYHRLMLLQNLIVSEEERLGRLVITAQREEESLWGRYRETRTIAKEIGIEDEWFECDEKLKGKKREWKRTVKRTVKSKKENI